MGGHRAYIAEVKHQGIPHRSLGQTAAPNLVVGRKGNAGQIKFDSGDEVLILDADRYSWPRAVSTKACDEA